MRRYILADTETTGLKNPQPVEVAWVECDEHFNIIHRVESLIDPQCEIESGAQAVHGISYQDVADQPTLQEFFTVVQDNPLGYGDVVYFGHNAAYDLQMLRPYIANLDAAVCTVKLARRIYPDAPNHKLQTLREWLDLGAGDAHRALGDVITTHSLIQRMMRDTGFSIDELVEFSTQPYLIERMPFGKHKGMPLESLPPAYRRWLLDLEDLDDNLRYSLTA